MISRPWKYILTALVFTLVAFPFVKILLLNPFEQESDFALSDFYARTEQRISAARASQDIVVLSVDNKNRTEITGIVKEVSDAGAAVVLLDVFMNIRQDGDDELRAILDQCPNLVLPVAIDEEFQYSVYDGVGGLRGYANLQTTSTVEQIRYGEVRQGSMSLAEAAILAYNPDITPHPGEWLINYSGVVFEELNADDVAEFPGLVEGKIVVVANVNDYSDVHPTPVGQMSGAYIHAYIAQTIMDGSQKQEYPGWVGSVIAFVLCFLLFLGNLYINLAKDQGDMANFFMRISQAILLVFLYWLGAKLFINRNVYLDLSIVLSLIGAESLLTDCVLGVRSLVLYFKNRRK